MLALAAIGTTGAFTAGLLGGGAEKTSVAAPGELKPSPTGVDSRQRPTGGGNVSGEQLVQVLKELLPGGTLTGTTGRGTAEGPMAGGVYDDGNGKAAINVGMWRLDPGGVQAKELTVCPDPDNVPVDGCTSKNLAGGSRLLVVKGYEYPDRRVDTKAWRATLVTKEGYVVDASEWNAAAEKDAPISRPTPPLDPTQLEALVRSEKWLPALRDLTPAEKEQPVPPGRGLNRPTLPVLLSHLPDDLTVVRKEGGGEFAEVRLDDGNGVFHVTVQLQEGMSGVLESFNPKGRIKTLPDGTKIVREQRPGEKGGEGVVWWTVDTVRPDGVRIIVSAFNSPAQHLAATRPEPGVTMALMEKIATDTRLTRDK